MLINLLVQFKISTKLIKKNQLSTYYSFKITQDPSDLDFVMDHLKGNQK